VGLLTTGKNKNREKYSGILQNPPHYPSRKFTSDKSLNLKIAKITEITDNYKNLVFGWCIFKSVSSV
jgi:hypothetical protein